jgi:tetratricopeptide (TPR) repeat protein
MLGRPEETFPLVEKAIRLSPHDSNLGEWYLSIGIAWFMMNQLEEAIVWLRRSTEANPELGINYSALAPAPVALRVAMRKPEPPCRRTCACTRS